MAYSLVLSKQHFKFSSSHFTIFSAKQAEALHGHNYTVAVKLFFDKVSGDLEMKVNFKTLKDEIQKICAALDEKILLPQASPYLEIAPSPHYAKHTEVKFNKRAYCFPDEEIFHLPLANITSEGLARYVCQQLRGFFSKDFSKIAVAIRETSGQAAIYSEILKD